MYSFPNFEPALCSMSSSNCYFLTCIQVFQETGKVVWYYHLLKSPPQFVVIHTVTGFHVISEAEVNVFYGILLLFLWCKKHLEIWYLIPLPSLNLACTFGTFSSCNVEAWFEGFQALPFYHMKWVQLCGSLNILWHCHSLKWEWKLIFSNPVAIAKFYEFSGMLSETN